MSEDADAAFVRDDEALVDEMGGESTCFFPFSRILFVASRPSA